MQANIPPTLTTRNCSRNPKNSHGSNLTSNHVVDSIRTSTLLEFSPQAYLRVIHTTLGSCCSLSTFYRCGTDVVHAQLICTPIGGGGGYWDGSRDGVDMDMDAEEDGC